MNTRVYLRTAALFDDLTDKLRRVFLRFGSYVRTRARSSMRPQRRKTLTEMTPDELKSFEIRKRIAKQKGYAKAKAPWAQTPKGMPIKTRSGLVKRYMSVAFSEEDLAAFIGPERVAGLNGRALWENEFGDHPYMRPALKAELPNLPRIWAEAISH